MQPSRIALLASAVLAAVASPALAASPPVGSHVADFALTDAVAGKPWSLARDARDAKAVVVVFVGTACPVNNAYAPTLADLAERYGPKGVAFVGVNSHAADDAADVARHARDFGLPFPVLKDEGTKLADRLAVERTPTAIVLDGTRTARYAGRIDDRFEPGVQRPKATKHELADAIDAILAGGEVKVPHAPAAGCRLTRTRAKAAAPSVTFTKHVAPVLQARCQECHRPGEAGPFPLLTFRDAADWADMIREVVDDGRMPPWHADPSVGKFRNERRLTEAEKRTLLDWVDQGCPEGDPADLPSPRVFAEGWRVGKPDLVVRMNDKLDVPATAPKNGVPYRYVYAGEPFREDTWVKAAEARPDARAVVHHILVFAVPPNPRLPADAPAEQLLGASFRGDDPDGFGQNLLAAYVPGDQPLVLPAGTAKKIAKGSRLVFEMHYTPDGKAREDRSSVGLVLAKGPPEHEVKTRAIANTDFTLVPLAGDQRVKSSTTFTRPTVLLSLSPHMHLRGKAFEYAAVPPGGEAERLLSVPKYDFNWQTPYVLAEPRRLPKGTRIDCVGRFDNSARNASNPNPWAVVRWGEQTWDEMMIGFVEYYEE